MKATLPLALLVPFVLLGIAAPAGAAGVADRIDVVDPYVRLTPPGAKATGAFMIVKNGGDKDTQIVSAASPAAQVVELHNHINDGGVMRMRQVKDIALPAKGEALLQPGGYHVMLIDMKAPLKEGDKVAITLGFADGSGKTIEAPVKNPLAGAMGGMDHGKMRH